MLITAEILESTVGFEKWKNGDLLVKRVGSSGSILTAFGLSYECRRGVDPFWLLNILPDEGGLSKRAFSYACLNYAINSLGIKEGKLIECLKVLKCRVGDPSIVSNQELEKMWPAVWDVQEKAEEEYIRWFCVAMARAFWGKVDMPAEKGWEATMARGVARAVNTAWVCYLVEAVNQCSVACESLSKFGTRIFKDYRGPFFEGQAERVKSLQAQAAVALMEVRWDAYNTWADIWQVSSRWRDFLTSVDSIYLRMWDKQLEILSSLLASYEFNNGEG
jgi:hypothetical protein